MPYGRANYDTGRNRRSKTLALIRTWRPHVAVRLPVPRLRIAAAIVAAGLMFISCGNGGTNGSSSGGSTDVSGQFLADPSEDSSAEPGSACDWTSSGTRGELAGTQVTLIDGDGSIVGISSLEQGVIDEATGLCKYAFAIADVELNSPAYYVRLEDGRSSRGNLYPREDLSSKHIQIRVAP